MRGDPTAPWAARPSAPSPSPPTFFPHLSGIEHLNAHTARQEAAARLFSRGASGAEAPAPSRQGR